MKKSNNHSRWRLSQVLLTLALLALISPLQALSVTFPDKPSSAHFYVDDADLITKEAGDRIDAMASSLLNEKKVPIYVVTIPSLAQQDAVTYTIERYAYELFNAWGIGWEDRNYGMLLLISEGDRKARIELGADWGHSYNYQAKQIMNDLIVPAFKRGDYSQGIVDGVRGLDALARGLELPEAEVPWWVLPVWILGLIFFILLVVNLFKRGQKGWAWALIVGVGMLLFFLMRNSGGSSGGFGGGFSGGGGATGSW